MFIYNFLFVTIFPASIVRICLLMLSGIVSGGCNHAMESNWVYRRVLPPTATEIKEFYQTDDFLPDYEYYLRAKISGAEFQRYCDTLGLKLHSDSSQYSDGIGNLHTGYAKTENMNAWWDTMYKSDSLFVWQHGDEWNIARYTKGYLYLYAHEH